MASSVAAAGSPITYQGRLTNTSGRPIPGPCHMIFTLYDAATGGSQVGNVLTKTNIELNNGYFVVELDFGTGVFNGTPRWMGIAVACPTSSPFVLLDGRVALTAAPSSHTLQPGVQVAWLVVGILQSRSVTLSRIAG